MTDTIVVYAVAAVVFALGAWCGAGMARSIGRASEPPVATCPNSILPTFNVSIPMPPVKPPATEHRCELCGQRVRVGGKGLTHYYIGVDAETVRRIRRSIATPPPN